jgi:beta-xylosidase
MLRHRLAVLALLLTLGCAPFVGAQTDPPAGPWVPDLGNGAYKNPVLFADYSDPDIVRVGGDYYMTASSFNCVPALPILHSTDLVNWTLIGHAAQELPGERFDRPEHGNGVWAPCFRYHDGWFWIFYGDPDDGCYMTKARDPRGPWEPLHLVHAAKGMIDTSPLWDDDGKAYLVNAWARSRAGFNSILTVHEMKPDGTELIGEGQTIFDGTQTHPTIEGPKFSRRGDTYYIFAPAGGVAQGWQTVLRADNPFGPYEWRNVLEQGPTDINGPHQGGWVDTPDGNQFWFMHFQEITHYGRVVHLNPMEWTDDGWVKMGIDMDGNGVGNPVTTHAKPAIPGNGAIRVPQTSDDFSADALGLQWQWQANPKEGRHSLGARSGWMRLFPVASATGDANLYYQPNFLLQKLPAPDFTATTKIDFHPANNNERAGLIVMGNDYFGLFLSKHGDGLRLSRVTCIDARGGKTEQSTTVADLPAAPLWLRVTIARKENRPHGTFAYSADGQTFTPIEAEFPATEGRWIGAKLGIFAITTPGADPGGHADFDFFRVE